MICVWVGEREGERERDRSSEIIILMMIYDIAKTSNFWLYLGIVASSIFPFLSLLSHYHSLSPSLLI